MGSHQLTEHRREFWDRCHGRNLEVPAWPGRKPSRMPAGSMTIEFHLVFALRDLVQEHGENTPANGVRRASRTLILRGVRRQLASDLHKDMFAP